jgi:hypothetical protein
MKSKILGQISISKEVNVNEWKQNEIIILSVQKDIIQHMNENNKKRII